MRRGQGVPQCYRKKKRNGMVTLPVVAVSGSWSRSRCDGEGGGEGGGGLAGRRGRVIVQIVHPWQG